MKTAEELIEAIRVNAPNLYHIAETGKINGSLKNDFEKIITDLLAKVLEQQKEIERLKTPSASTLEIEKMIAGLKEVAIHYDEMAYKLGYTGLMKHTMTYVMLTENYPKLVSEQSQRIQQLEEALREVVDGCQMKTSLVNALEKAVALLTPKQ